MKVLVILFSFMFITFLAMPTTVMLIKQDADISYVFNFSEEEETSNSGSSEKKGGDELQWKVFCNENPPISFANQAEKAFSRYYVLNTHTIYFDLLSPPPEIA